MIVGAIVRFMLLTAILEAYTAEGDERKMRTALAASLAGIHGAIMNLSMSQSIRADVGDLFLVFGEYRGIRYMRYAGFLTIEYYLILAGSITLGLIAYYAIGMSVLAIPIRAARIRKKAPRLFFSPYRALL
jgi:hypothetical protein